MSKKKVESGDKTKKVNNDSSNTTDTKKIPNELRKAFLRYYFKIPEQILKVKSFVAGSNKLIFTSESQLNTLKNIEDNVINAYGLIICEQTNSRKRVNRQTVDLKECKLKQQAPNFTALHELKKDKKYAEDVKRIQDILSGEKLDEEQENLLENNDSHSTQSIPFNLLMYNNAERIRKEFFKHHFKIPDAVLDQKQFVRRSAHIIFNDETRLNKLKNMRDNILSAYGLMLCLANSRSRVRVNRQAIDIKNCVLKPNNPNVKDFLALKEDSEDRKIIEAILYEKKDNALEKNDEQSNQMLQPFYIHHITFESHTAQEHFPSAQYPDFAAVQHTVTPIDLSSPVLKDNDKTESNTTGSNKRPREIRDEKKPAKRHKTTLNYQPTIFKSNNLDINQLKVSTPSSTSTEIVTPIEKRPFCIQIPSYRYLYTAMGMKTGLEKVDQMTRLTTLSNDVPHNEHLKLITTDEKILPNWESLFMAIANKDADNAKDLFDKINDPLKEALLAVHDIVYINELIAACIDRGKKLDKYGDTIVNSSTFEMLIREIATTINNFKEYKIVENIGLPSHHAYFDHAAGFCILNKIAILIHYFQQPEIIIIDIDVNGSDGLRNTLKRNTPKTCHITHTDSLDTRIYPYWELTEKNKDNYHYIPFYLNDKKYEKEKGNIHPILLNILEKVKDILKDHPENTAIYIAHGGDSHEDELAYCGKGLSKRISATKVQFVRTLPVKEAKTCRYNDDDFSYFYQQLNQLIEEFKVPFVYISFEGGYTDSINKKQILMLAKTFQGAVTYSNQNTEEEEKSVMTFGQ